MPRKQTCINDSIDTKIWNSSPPSGKNYNDWDSSSLETYLNNDYYNSINNDKVITSTWNIGELANNNETITNIMDTYEAEHSVLWNGKIALFTVSEYNRTNSNFSCIVSPSNYYPNQCNKTTWLYNAMDEWTLTPLKSDWHDYAWYIYKDGEEGF